MVKLSLSWAKHHAMKKHGDSSHSYTHSTSVRDGDKCKISGPAPISRGNCLRMGQRGPQSRSGFGGEEKNYAFPVHPRNQTSVFQPVAWSLCRLRYVGSHFIITR